MRADARPLGEVVRAITRALGVRLEAKIELKDPVTLDRTGGPEQVLGQLLRGRNVVLDSNPSAACHGREVLTTVWILPAGQEGPPREASAAVAPPPVIVEPTRAEFRQVGPKLPPKFRRRGGHLLSPEEKQEMTRKWRAGELTVDPQTGELVPKGK
ncbi:MAG TPA: hypothetical protein VM240_08345 [Verrucomicrobiae bacterium]|nr:hypothetical protein [Verrucomicrobiae bacterium]